jgi:hypothetical protein
LSTAPFQIWRTSLRPDYDSERLPTPNISRYTIEFRLEGATFRVTAQTAAAARVFGVNVQ